jgi:hypothetical protein
MFKILLSEKINMPVNTNQAASQLLKKKIKRLNCAEN